MTMTTPTGDAGPVAVPEIRGMRLNVYRALHNCSNGISAWFGQVTVIGIVDETDGGKITPVPDWRQSGPSDDAPPVVVVVRRRFRSVNTYPNEKHAFLRPFHPAGSTPDGHTPWYMHGGNDAGGGSLFTRAVEEVLGYPVGEVLPMHDRTA
ncbi:hypothetical protein JK358_38245 [Nocardia sp. 2]|uniref:Uncharacterized protein n=1 Tax=Nocardia acididurans TaxID=2802282 RepID=A0ABS1MHW3_9NOCA|nr:hypothetical protein [Nocardia acididurans]MBL1080253.1 hypothetical protein [Nocardia acididurans]